MMWLLIVCQIGCRTVDKPAPDGTPDPADTGADLTPDTGWQVEEAPCADPRPLSYRNLDAEIPVGIWAPPTTNEFAEGQAGGLALLEAPSGRMLIYTLPDTTVGILNLETMQTSSVLSGRRGSLLFSVEDLDASGVPDLIVAGLGMSIFWDFDGDPGVPTEIHMGGKDYIRDVSVADFDGDGLLDMLLSTNSPFGDSDSLQSHLIRGTGGRNFAASVPVEAPESFWGKVFDTAALDVNGDGAPDVYLCNDLGAEYAPDGLLLNDGAGVLAPAADARGLDVRASCMGQGWGDIDRDGRLDVVLGDAKRLWVLAQDGAGFYDASAEIPVSVAPETQMLWGVAPVDMDNDGYTDLVLPSSWFWMQEAEPWPAWLYLQTGAEGGGSAWAEAGAELGLPQSAGTRTVLTPDLNGDGTPDLLLGDGWRSPHILVSEGCTEGAWVEISAPSGSTAVVEAGGVRRAALVTADGSFASAQPAVAHIGLGDATTIDRIIVHIPWRGALVMAGPIPARSRVRAPL